MAANGAKIAFFEFEQETTPTCFSGCLEISRDLVIGSKGGAPHVLAEDSREIGHVLGEGTTGVPFSISADGAVGGFYSDRETEGRAVTGVNIGPLSGTVRTSLLATPYEGLPTVLSEGGNRFAFTGHPPESSEVTGIFLARVDGSGVVRIVPGGPKEFARAWGRVVLP